MRSLQIYDTRTSQKIEVSLEKYPQIGLYVCGPTVYDYIHVGNALPLVVFDVLVRYLRFVGHQVTYVRNITDVDDRIITKGQLEGKSSHEIAQQYFVEFSKDCLELKCLPPSVEPKATMHIPEMIQLISDMIDEQSAYVADGDVYFSVSSFKNYGKLSNTTVENLIAGSRIEVDPKKREPADFVLWKAAKPNEVSFDSPFGPGRPGWHIECSAMALKYLGTSFLLHGGGIDLRFPHHENEIAQSQSVYGPDSFASYFMHNGRVGFRWVFQGQMVMEGAKISKSDEKLAPLRDVFLARHCVATYGGEAVRLFLLTAHYRNPVSLDVEAPLNFLPHQLRIPALEEAEKRIEYMYRTKLRLNEQVSQVKDLVKDPCDPQVSQWLEDFLSALSDDMNTPEAIAVLQTALTYINRLLDAPAKDDLFQQNTLLRCKQFMDTASSLLGLFEEDPKLFLEKLQQRRMKSRNLDRHTVEDLLNKRTEARKAKDYQKGDQYKQQLSSLGVEVRDEKEGSIYWVKNLWEI